MRRGVMNVLSFGLFCILPTILQIIIDQSILNFSMISLENWGLRSIKRIEREPKAGDTVCEKDYRGKLGKDAVRDCAGDESGGAGKVFAGNR